MSKNPKTLTINNTKGGVGKTTLSTNLSAALARQGKSVLLVDNEPQADTTLWTSSFDHTDFLEDYYMKELNGKDYTLHPFESDVFGIDIIPCTSHLVDVETELSNMSSSAKRNRILSGILSRLDKEYDYVIIDNMPTLSFLVINALVASDFVIIPTQPSFLSASRIKNVLGYVRRINESSNPKLAVMGISIQMVENRTIFGRDMTKSIRKSFSEINVFNSMIPYSIRVPESTFLHTPIYGNKKSERVATAFDQLAKEVINYEKKF